MKSNHYNNTHQRGSVLLISMMLLIVLTLLTFTVSDSVLLQEKMTSSSRDSMLALQVAEAALLEGESNAQSLVYELDGGVHGFFDGDCDVDTAECYLNTLGDVYDDASWGKSMQAQAGVECGNGDANCFLQGRYMIVKLNKVDMTLSGADQLVAVTNQYQDQTEGAIDDVFVYKVIAMGTGINPENKRVIVSHFAAAESE